MASRRDELNAYTFAKREAGRTVPAAPPVRLGGGRAAPAARGGPRSRSSASSSWRSSAPGGCSSPRRPRSGTSPYENVIIASKSTTRYVVLKTDGKTQLHPVLNMSSRQAAPRPRTRARSSTSTSRSSTAARSRTAPPSASRTPPTACPTRPKPAPPSAGRSASGPARAAGPSRRRRSSSPSASRRRPRAANRLRGGELMYVEGPGQGPLRRGRHGHGVRGRRERRTAAAHPRRHRAATRSGSPRTGWPPCTRATRSPSRSIEGDPR